MRTEGKPGVIRLVHLTVCSVCSGSGGEGEAEAGERDQDEEERISDEGAGEAQEATR